MGKTILLVEDEAIIALSTKMGLEKYGYSVITTGTGEKAVEIVKDSPLLDIILMDIDLGSGIDGTVAAKQILEIRDIPLLFLSSHIEKDIVEKTEKITSYGYVVKNSSLTVLDASIKMAFKLYNANKATKTTLNRFKSTLNALPDILFEVGIDGYLYDVHTNSPELLFLPPEEIKGKNSAEFLPPKPAEIILSAIKEAREKGISRGKQYELEVPAGKRIFEISVAPIVEGDSNGHFIYLSRDITNRKKAEDLLSRSEQKYKQLNTLFRMVADNMKDMLWAKDMEGRFIFVNKANARFLNAVDTDEPIGKDDMFFVNRERSLHPDNPEWITFGELCTNSDNVVKESQKTGRFDEFGNIRGEFLFLEVIKSPLFNEKNEMIGTVGEGRDVTEQKRLEKELEYDEEKYHTIADFTYDWEYWLKPDGKFAYVSPSCKRITGYSRDEFLQDPDLLEKIIYPEDMKIYKNHIHQVLANEEVKPIEYRIITKSKEIRWISHVCRTVYDNQGNHKGQRGSNRDITAQKKIEKELIASNIQMKAIFDSNPNPTHIVNRNFEIVLSNRRLLELKNVKQESIIGKKCYEVYQNRNEICTNCAVERVFETKSLFKYENQLTLPNGKLRYFETYAYPVFDVNNQVSYAVETTIDITERKQAERLILENEKRYQLLIKNTKDSIVGVDETGRIITWNKASESLFGISAHEALNENLWDFHHKLIPSEHKNSQIYQKIKMKVINMLKTGELNPCAETEREIQKPDGKRIFIQSTFSLYHTENGFNLMRLRNPPPLVVVMD